MNEIIQEAKRIAKENLNADIYLPDLEPGQKCRLSEVWDGNGEVPEDGYSYELGHGDFIEYDFETLQREENALNNVVMITDVWIGGDKVSEREQEILETLAEALPKMNDMKKGELLGYGKAMVDIKKTEAKGEENEPDRNNENAD